MERLHALDAEFLSLEDGAVHMHIGAACVFPDPPPSCEELEHLVAAKLHLIPRYRQRVLGVPLELGRPIWVDDPHFDLRHHILHTVLPHPGDDAEFRALVGRIMSQPLDRQRPLWEMWLVEGLSGGRWALVCKVHHCMVDGVAGVGLLALVLSTEPDSRVGEPEPWDPRHAPPAPFRVADAWAGLAADSFRLARRALRAAVDPRRAVTSVTATAGGAARFLARLVPTRGLSIEGPIGPHRVWAHSSASFAHVKTIRQAFGGTVNDVALAAVTGGYRSLLLDHGDDVDHAELRSLVPVSTRHTEDGGASANRIAALLYDLPVQIADPVDRLERVRVEMAALKSTHMIDAGEAVTSLADLTPPMVLEGVTRCAIRTMHRFGQPSLNTVTTNVPGPAVPFYCLGRELCEYQPFVPISHGLRVGTAIISYNGTLFFGVTGDEDTVPDVDVVAAGAAECIADLYDRALVRLGDHRPS